MTSLVMYLVVLLGALAALPASSCLPFTIKTDDASIGFFRYGPSADAWRVCRPTDSFCSHRYKGTTHFTSSIGAFVEFWSIAGRIEVIGHTSTSSRIQVMVDDCISDTAVFNATDGTESQVLWAKSFDNDLLRLVRVTNLDGKLELDYVMESPLDGAISDAGALHKDNTNLLQTQV